MALTPSTMQTLGTKAPDFSLPDSVSGKQISLSEFRGKPLLVMFICRHCPYVKHIESELARFGRDYAGKELALVAISSNDAEKYPDDAPDKLSSMAKMLGFTFPLCYDESQTVAQSYGASCTPDFFLYDSAHALVYRGQFDGSRPGNAEPVTGRDLRAALDAVLSGRSVVAEQRPSLGCNIKWKPGNEPAYFGK